MNPITLPTSSETRAALENTGLLLMKERPGFEEWRTKDEASAIGLFRGSTPAIHGDWGTLAPALVILGITIPGYRIIPEETALVYLAARTGFFGKQVDGDPAATMENWTNYEDAEEVLAVALGGARLLPPHQTPIQDQAAAIQTEGRPVWPVGDGKPPGPLPVDDPLPVPPLEYPPQPQPSVDGGLSPSPPRELSGEDLRIWSEVTASEPGFHQVNPINQRKAPVLSDDPFVLLEVLYNSAVNDSRLDPDVERQIRRVLGLDRVAGPGEGEKR